MLEESLVGHVPRNSQRLLRSCLFVSRGTATTRRRERPATATCRRRSVALEYPCAVVAFDLEGTSAADSSAVASSSSIVSIAPNHVFSNALIRQRSSTSVHGSKDAGLSEIRLGLNQSYLLVYCLFDFALVVICRRWVDGWGLVGCQTSVTVAVELCMLTERNSVWIAVFGSFRTVGAPMVEDSVSSTWVSRV